MKYITKKGDMLDSICWRYYILGDETLSKDISYLTLELNRTSSAVRIKTKVGQISGIIESVLEANPGLAKYLVLPAGIVVDVPLFPQIGDEVNNAHLWD